MKYTELQAEAEKDLGIDTPDLEYLSLITPKTIAKWLNYMTEEYRQLVSVQDAIKEKQSELWKYYKYDYDYTLDNRQEIQMMVDGHKEMRDLKRRESILKNKLDFIEQVVKTLQQRTFNIKNILEYRKFINGG